VETAECSSDGLTVIQLEPSVSVSDAIVLGKPSVTSEEVRNKIGTLSFHQLRGRGRDGYGYGYG
jgi:hypothetical protein